MSILKVLFDILDSFTYYEKYLQFHVLHISKERVKNNDVLSDSKHVH